MKTINLKYRQHYSMPTICVACGSSGAFESMDVDEIFPFFSKRLGLYSMTFPLCSDCFEKRTGWQKRRQTIALQVLGAGVALFLLTAIPASFSQPNTLLRTIVNQLSYISCIAIPAAAIFYFFANQSMIGPGRSVRVHGVATSDYLNKDGNVSVSFANIAFADAFRQANLEAVKIGLFSKK